MQEVIYFASPDDLRTALQRVVAEHEVEFVQTGMFPDSSVKRIGTLTSRSSLGVNRSGNYIGGDSFLIIPKDAPISTEAIEQERGGTKYFISQKGNEGSVQLILSGKFNDDVLVAGRIATVSEIARPIFLGVKRSLLQGFRRIDGYFVSAEAYKWLAEGKRLTTHARSSLSLDLRL